MLRSRPPAIARALPLALVAFALAIAPVACGGLGEDELRKQAAEICTRTAAATDRIALPSRPSEGRAFLAEGVAHLRRAIRALDALEPPGELRERYERAVELARSEAALIARHERAIARGEDVIDTFRRLDAELEPLTRQEDAYWRGLGIPECVRR